MPAIIGLKYVLSFQANLILNKILILGCFHDDSEISVFFVLDGVSTLFPPSSYFYVLPHTGARGISGR